MKAFLQFVVLSIVFASTMVVSDDTYVRQTFPGSNIIDYSKPAYRVEGDMIRPTMSGTSMMPDYSQQGYRVDNGVVRQTMPGSRIIDTNAPGWSLFGK